MPPFVDLDMKEEKRQFPKRKQVLIPAVVTDRERTFAKQCVIRDLSEGGCKIVMPKAYDLPEHIMIKISQFKGRRSGTVIWSNAGMAGVKFDVLHAQNESSASTSI